MSAERGELHAFLDMFAALPASLGPELGAVATQIGGATCTALPALAASREFNRVTGLGESEPFTDADLEAVDRFYADAGAPGYVVTLSPTGAALGLRERLEARGFTEAYAWMKFARPAADPPPATTDLEIAPARPDQADAFAAVAIASFGMPGAFTAWLAALVGRRGWTCMLALDGEEPVGAGALHVHDGAGWLGIGGTLPAARGRGAQSSLLAARIAAAQAVGAVALETETGERVDDRPSASYRNILRAGFTEAYLRPNFASPGFQG